MQTRQVALIYGIVFLLAGVAGFMAQEMPPGAPDLAVRTGYGLALGLFPVNILHNIVHLLFGLLGLAAFGGMFSARAYMQIVAVAYGLLVVLGLIPGLNTTFGLIPIYGNDVWLHLLLAAPAAYFGFMAQEPLAARR